MAILSVRRRVMCLLDWIYRVQHGFSRTTIIRLPQQLVTELWLLVLLGPLSCVNLRWNSIPEVFLSDASESTTASVVADIPLCFAKELQRHCLTRGNWSKLLSPWKAWLRSHEQLFDNQELPDGVPLVCHPIWLLISAILQFRLYHRSPVRQKKHINLLELQSILEVERKLSLRRQGVRYLLAADSQVALAALVKGRSSSPRLNLLLQRSLGTVLGSCLVGNYGYIPSLANTSDDPTRGKEIRKPSKAPPFWWYSALEGDFTLMDKWLESLGFDPLHLAKLPFGTGEELIAGEIRKELLAELRSVQKPDRLDRFDENQAQSKQNVSPVFAESEKTECRRQEESDDQTKKSKKSPTKNHEEKGQHHSVASNGRASPEKSKEQDKVRVPEIGLELSEEARNLLADFHESQFIAPSGRRGLGGKLPRRQVVLDLYSGAAGVAREVAKKFGLYVLTFDFERGAEQDLLSSELQEKLLHMMRAGCFCAVGAAPECCSFSKAVRPPVRTRDHPEGIANISLRMKEKIRVGNCHAAFMLRVIKLAEKLNIAYWCENPDGSFLWLLQDWQDAGIGHPSNSYRCDQCIYKTPWRKRTRIATNTGLRGMKELCQGGHSHLRLTGRSKEHGCSWTRVAQKYPRGLCQRIAVALGIKAGFLPRTPQTKMNIANCARCGSLRVGEASHPGPAPRLPRNPRDAAELLGIPLVNIGTLRLQERIWTAFENWLSENLSQEAQDQVFYCPTLAIKLVRQYGVHLYSSGSPLYELRHFLVLVQQKRPELRPLMAPCWMLVTKWEELHPVVHRQPLHEVLFKAMFSIAVFWGWQRFAATLLLGMEGIGRVGEVLAARRSDLVLPSDTFEERTGHAFLKVRKPKDIQTWEGENPAPESRRRRCRFLFECSFWTVK